MKKFPKAKIAITNPTRVGINGSYERLNSQGYPVFARSGESSTSGQVTFYIPRSLLNDLRDGCRYDIILIDEAHEDSAEN